MKGHGSSMTCLDATIRVCRELHDVRVRKTGVAMSYLGRALVGAATLATVSFTVSIALQHDLQRLGGPELRRPHGPESDIRASVRPLREEARRPHGQGGGVIEPVARGGPADNAGLRAGTIVTELDAHTIAEPVQFATSFATPLLAAE
jgi:hypothetical protein